MAEQTAGAPRREVRIPAVVFDKLTDVLILYISMHLSELLVSNVLLGGAICLVGQVLIVYQRLYNKRNSALLPLNIQARGVVLFIGCALQGALLLFVYPAVTHHANFNVLLVCVLLLLLQYGITSLLTQRVRLRRLLRAPILLMVHALFILGCMLPLYPLLAPEEYASILTMAIAGAALALARQLMIVPPPPPQERRFPNPTLLFNISAYRVYNRMVSAVAVALNLMLLTYICTMPRVKTNIIGEFWDLVIWLTLVGAMTLLSLYFLRRSALTKYDKPSVFAFGALMILFAISGTYRNWFSGWGTLPGYFLWGSGLACLLSILISMGFDMQAVLELGMTPEEAVGYQSNTYAVVEWNLMFSTLLVLIMLTLLTFIGEGRMGSLFTLPFVRFLVQGMTAWPAICIAAAMLFALTQPLNKDYAKKLLRFQHEQQKGNINPALYTRLQLKLVRTTQRALPSILRAVIRPILPCKIVGAAQVDTENGPVVFVCNHLEVYGPLVTNVRLPFYFRSWVISQMLDKEAVACQLESGINIIFRWLPQGIRKKLPRLFAPLVLYILQSFDPIPVYRGTIRDVIKTISLTVDAMEYDDNILLFPENPAEGNYKEAGVSQLFSGFVTIGSEYYKRTGKCTTFYPMYADKYKRTLTIGEGIHYSPENGKSREKERIVNALHSWMETQAEK